MNKLTLDFRVLGCNRVMCQTLSPVLKNRLFLELNLRFTQNEGLTQA